MRNEANNAAHTVRILSAMNSYHANALLTRTRNSF